EIEHAVGADLPAIGALRHQDGSLGVVRVACCPHRLGIEIEGEKERKALAGQMHVGIRQTKRWKPVQRSATSSTIAVAMMRSVDTAATLGFTPISTEVKMRMGRVVSLGPARKIVTGTFSIDVTKENSAPATRPGLISGSVTSRNVVKPLAPSTRAASSTARSMPDRLASADRTMYGTVMTTCAISSTQKLPRMPTSVKYCRSATPITTDGMMSGAMSSEVSASEPGT